MDKALLYCTTNAPQRSDTRYILQNYVKLIKWNEEGHDVVLDIGSGPGDVTKEILQPFLPENFDRLIGVDSSKDMVDFAQQYYTGLKVNFKCLDISTKQIPKDFEQEFHHIFSFYTLHWISDQRQLWKNIHTLLKPGGDILTSFLASGVIYDVYHKLSLHPKWMQYMADKAKFITPYQYYVDPISELEKIVDEAGFDVGICKTFDSNHVYTDIEEYKKFVVSISPFIKRLPENMHEDYLNDFIAEVRRINGESENGKFIVNSAKLFILYAKKPSQPIENGLF